MNFIGKKILCCYMLLAACCLSADFQWSSVNGFRNWAVPERLTAERADGLLKLNITGKDSSLTNLNADVDCSKFQRLQITYRASGFAGSTTGQVFFRSASQSTWMHDQYWMIPSLECDSKWHTIDLYAASNIIGGLDNWLKCGKVSALRLDIVDQFPGQVEIRSIRFLEFGMASSERWPDVKVELPSEESLKKSEVSVGGAYFHGVMIKARGDNGAAVQKFDFRRVFRAPADLQRALVQATGDDEFELYINNVKVLSNNVPDGWSQTQSAEVLKHIKPGQLNIISGTYKNNGGPGGILLELTMLDKNKRVARVISDKSFRAAPSDGKTAFHDISFNSRKFEPMLELVCPPSPPWTKVLDFIDIEPRTTFNISELHLPEQVSAGDVLPINMVLTGDGVLPDKWRVQFELRTKKGRLLKSFPLAGEKLTRRIGRGKYLLRYSLPLMRYFSDCELVLHVKSSDIRFMSEVKKNFFYRQKNMEGKAYSYKVVRQKGSDYPVLLQDGKAVYPMIGNTESEVDLRRFEMSKFDLVPMQFRMFWCRNTLSRSWWIAPDEFDFTIIDEYFEALLQNDPNAEVIVGVGTELPAWWGKLHPDELVRYHDQSTVSGGMAATSFASELHFPESARALKKLIEHCSKAPYAKRIAGYQLTNGVSCEWQYWGCHTASPQNKLTDYSLPMQKAFARFAAERYPEIPADERTIPVFEERIARDETVFFPAKKQLHNIAFANCMSEVLSDLLLKLTKVARETAGADKLIAVYYGYTFEYTNLRWCVSLSGHNALRKILASPDIDILISPQSYGVRNIGDSGEDMKPFASIRAAGKLPVIDDDTRTHLTPPAGFFQTLNPKQTQQVMRRNYGRVLARQEPLCLLPLGKGVEFSSPEIIADIKRFKAVSSYAIEKPPVNMADIAVVISEKAHTVLGLEKRILPRSLQQSYNNAGKAVVNMRENQIHTGELIYSQRDRFARVGAPVDYILAEDLQRAAERPYKLWIFLNAFNPDADFVNALDTIRRRGNTTFLWLHAPGMFFNDRPADMTLIRSLTGMDLVPVSGEVRVLAELVGGGLMGSNDLIKPLFAVKNAPGVEPMAVYCDAPDQTAIAARQDGSVRSIFWGGIVLTADFVRNIARDAGIHIYTDSGDILYANSRFASFHASTPGKKVIKLPQASDVVDVFEGRIVARNVNEFEFTAGLHDSYIFALGNAEEILQTLKK